jgi:hypothetical protein
MLTDLMARTQISVKILLRQLTVTMANIQPPRSCAITVTSALNSSLDFFANFHFLFRTQFIGSVVGISLGAAMTASLITW